MLPISRTARKSNESVTGDIIRSLINKICKHQATVFWPCDENRAPGTSYDDWNDCKKTQQQKIVWTNKMAQSRRSDRYTESDKRYRHA